MNNLDLTDVSAILNYGLGIQHEIADLNQAASLIMRQRDFGEIFGYFDEIMAMASETGEREMDATARRLDDICDRFLEWRIDLIKESHLLKELRGVNEIYLAEIIEGIEEAEAVLKKGIVKDNEVREMGDNSLENTLKKRINELRTTQSVAQSFSAQLQLALDNCSAMAERIWNVQVNLIPLVRTRVLIDAGQKTMRETKLLIRKNVKDMELLCGDWEDLGDESRRGKSQRGGRRPVGFNNLFKRRSAK